MDNTAELVQFLIDNRSMLDNIYQLQSASNNKYLYITISLLCVSGFLIYLRPTTQKKEVKFQKEKEKEKENKVASPIKPITTESIIFDEIQEDNQSEISDLEY
jgi:hypothetical protein